MTQDNLNSIDGTPCSASAAWLDDYVDGELELARVVEVEAHLETCAACRRDVDGLRSLLQRVETLPAERAPSRDLWQDIAPRLQQRPSVPQERPASRQSARTRDGWRFWAAQAVAAGLFLLLGFGAAQWMGNGVETSPLRLTEAGETYASLGDGTSLDVRPAGLDGGSTSFLVAEAEYLRAKEALLLHVLQRRDAMSPETLELLYRNLQVIDAATVELRHALRQDPANPRLEGWVLDNYRRELSLLKRLTSQDV